MILDLTYRELLIGLLVGRCLPGKFDIFLCVLALDRVEALLARRSHVAQPVFSQLEGQGRIVKTERDPGRSESLGGGTVCVYLCTPFRFDVAYLS
jgi:hypothetical protein